MNIGIKIKTLRENQRLSQTELAFELGISQGTLHNIESGISKKIDFLLMSKVCRFFNKDFEYFLDGNYADSANGQASHYPDYIVTHFPENFLEEFKKLVQQNQDHEKMIKELKNQINSQ
jgi:transcriptional regulator with XRE-family HTH domain